MMTIIKLASLLVQLAYNIPVIVEVSGWQGSLTQQPCELIAKLRLIKAAVTRWLPHGKDGECVLNCLGPIVSSLNEIFTEEKMNQL